MRTFVGGRAGVCEKERREEAAAAAGRGAGAEFQELLFGSKTDVLYFGFTVKRLLRSLL